MGAAMFLLADRIAPSRRDAGDAIDDGAWHAPRDRLGVTYFVLAISAAGMPPLAGFLGKAQLLQGALDSPLTVGVWAAVLLSSLAIVVALARTGSRLFWRAAAANVPEASAVLPGQRIALALLAAGLVAAPLLAGPLSTYTTATAAQLAERRGYLDAVLSAQPAAPAWNVREGMVKE
jgi:multicomponent K+:H+ antiporter subunit D